MESAISAVVPMLFLGLLVFIPLSFRRAWARTALGWTLLVFGGLALIAAVGIGAMVVTREGKPEMWAMVAMQAAVGSGLVWGGFRARNWAREPIRVASSAAGPDTMIFRNPANGYEERIEQPMLWTFLLGAIYFGYKGVWLHAFLGMLLVVPTMGISWFVYPFFAARLMRQHYLRAGWAEVTSGLAAAA